MGASSWRLSLSSTADDSADEGFSFFAFTTFFFLVTVFFFCPNLAVTATRVAFFCYRLTSLVALVSGLDTVSRSAAASFSNTGVEAVGHRAELSSRLIVVGVRRNQLAPKPPLSSKV